MSYPLPPGGLFPLTTAPTGRTAGGAYPLPSVLVDAIKSLNPTAYWKLDEASGDLADAMSGGYTATVTGSPTYGVAAPSPIGRGVTFSGTGQLAATATSIPTPATSVSALVAFATSDATAAIRILMGRGAASQQSWSIQLTAANVIQAYVLQSGGSTHATCNFGSPVNTGAWMLALLTFDGTTLYGRRASGAGFQTGSSTTLTSTWHKASTAAVQIAARASTTPFIGTLAHGAYWSDRVITDAEFRWLGAIAFGG